MKSLIGEPERIQKEEAERLIEEYGEKASEECLNRADHMTSEYWMDVRAIIEEIQAKEAK